MAYLTTLPSNDTYEHCTFAPISSTATDWEIEFSVINPESGTTFITKRSTNLRDYVRLYVAGSGEQLLLRADNVSHEFLWPKGSTYERDDQLHVYKVTSSSGVLSATLDGVVADSTITATVSFSGHDRFFDINGSNGSPFALSYFKFTEAGTLVNHWDAASAGGTGSTLPDIVGTSDATLVNFPVDDSQWGPVLVPSTTLTNGPLEPGKAITGTYANYTAAPTTLTLTDSEGNSITPAVTVDDTAKTFAFTMPALAEAVTAGTSLLFGDVTIELST